MTRQRLTTGGLYFIAIAAFILSYDALRLLALASGVAPWLTWLYPLVFDAVGIVAALIIVDMIEQGDNTKYAWGLTVGFALLSVAGNILHIDTAAAPWLPMVVFAIPPTALALTFHLFTQQLTNNIKRKVAAPVDSVKPVVSTLDTVPSEPVVKRVKSVKPAPVAGKQDVFLRYLAANPHAPITEAAKAAEVSRQTGTKYVTVLTEAGRLSKNGGGWKVSGGV